jgi:hypothetical protein
MIAASAEELPKRMAHCSFSLAGRSDAVALGLGGLS